MALCFTHTAAGYLAYEVARPADMHRPGLLAAAVALANAADLDFVPGVLLGHPAAFHRGITHTVVAALLVGVAVALVGRLMGRSLRAWFRLGSWAAAVYASHLVVDFFTADVGSPSGAPFLWPVSDRYFLAPVTLLPEIVIDPSGRRAFLASLFAPHTGRVWATEIGILVLTVGAVQTLRAWCPRPALRDASEDI